MSVSPASFKIRFPEFDSISDERIQLFLDDATLDMNEAFWGAKFDIGKSYLAAHYLQMSIKTDEGKYDAVSQIISKSVEGVSVTYASNASENSENFFLSTLYGQRYLKLKKSLGPGVFIV